MPFEPVDAVSGFSATPELPRPAEDTGDGPGFGEVLGSAFRQENTIGSLLARRDEGFSSIPMDPNFDPWAQIADTPYEAYGESFARARNREHFDAIKADIDRENKDRDTLSRAGLTGFVAGTAAGVLDWPTLLPGGAIVRNAKGATSLLRSAGSVAAYGAAGAAASEAALQATQQLRTAGESATVIGGGAVLSGLLGAGWAKYLSRGDLDRLARQVERDFEVPGASDPDAFEPGGLRPSVEAAAGAGDAARAVADSIRETAETILPPKVRVRVVDTLGTPSGEGLFAIRAYHGGPHDFDRFDMSKLGTGEGAQAFGHGLYFAENEEVAKSYRTMLGSRATKEADFESVQTGDATDFIKAHPGEDFDDAIAERFDYGFPRLVGRKPLWVFDDGTAVLGGQGQQKAVRAPGHLYEVSIDVEPHQLLDWDKPLSEHDPAVRRALQGLLDEVQAQPGEWVDLGDGALSLLPRGAEDSDISLGLIEALPDGRWSVQSDSLAGTFSSEQAAKDAVESYIRKGREASGEHLSGRDIYQRLEERLGSPQAASDALREAGIPGIRFLDEGSRDAAEGTRNIVAFDDRLISITAKNGKPVTSAERRDLVDQLFGIRPTQAGSIAEGRFDPQQLLITIAADALDPAKTLRHESIHALRTMGLITDSEWRTLMEAAKREGWLETHNVRQLYEGIYKDRVTDELLTEEAIAERFSLWRQDKMQVTGAIAALFERIRAFLERTGNALRGRGFQTADDVFAAVRSGEVASRGAPSPVPAASPRAAATSGRATSAGAAAVEHADDTLKSAFGVEKAMSFQDPLLRLQTSPSPVSRRYVQELAETPLTYEKNALGEETAPIGSEMGAPGSVETRIKMWQAPLADAVQRLDDLFIQYRKGHAKRFPGERSALTMKDALLGTQAMTWREFKEAVSAAAIRGDDHPIPEVAAAAKYARAKVLDPLKDAAIKTGQLPEDVSVETAASYLMRLYNKTKIAAQRPQFKAVIAKWLGEQETANQGVRSRLQGLLDDLDEAEAVAAKAEEKIPKREARLKEIEARAEEVARVHKFAFERALSRREPIEKLQQRIADLGEQIAAPLDDLAAVKGLESRVSDARQIAKSMQDGAGGDLALQLADVAELESGIDDLITKGQEALEGIKERGDLPVPKVTGRYAGPPLTADEIDEAAASWRFIREQKARRKPERLTSFVVRMGGVEDPGGDVRSLIGRGKDRPGLIRKARDDSPQMAGLGDRGSNLNTLDAMALRAQENGFFEGMTERPTVNDLLDALREDLTDQRVVRTADEQYFRDVEQADALRADMEARGIDPAKFSRESQLRLYLGEEAGSALAGEAGGNLRALRLIKAELSQVLGPYRQRIAKLTGEARRRERAEGIRQAERGAFAGQARGRSRSLADQVFRRRAELDKLKSDAEAANARMLATQQAIEEEIGKYQGKSASEAKAAIEARARREVERGEERIADAARRDALVQQIAQAERDLATGAPLMGPKDPRMEAIAAMRKEVAALERRAGDPRRLRSADKPVLAAARRIAAQLDKEPGEIQDLAEEIIDRILGTPDGRLPYDAHNPGGATGARGGAGDAPRGPLAARQFMIPDELIEPWLERDYEELLRTYTRTMAADVEMYRRFGSLDLAAQRKEIVEDYARMAAAAATEKERLAIQRRKERDIRDFAAIRDRILGTYNLPSNPDGFMVRAGRVISSLNYMRMLGSMTVSAIPDLGGVVFAHGLQRVFGDGLMPLFRNWKGARLAMTELKTAGTALEMVMDTRAMNIGDVMDAYGRGTKFERAVNTAARNFGLVSLQTPWNSGLKQFTGLISMTRMLRAVERFAAGKASASEIERLAASYISEANARKIAEQFGKHGRKEGGVWFPNTELWDEGARPAKEAFRAALVREVDRTIITPGQDRPLWMSSEMGRLIGQFKSFSIAAMQRLVIAGLQQRDMSTLNGAALMVALGGLVGVLKAKLGGQPLPEYDDNKKRMQALVDAVDRSGLTGWLMEANAMTEKLTSGAVGLSAVTGKPISRYAQRNLTGSLLGPTVGTIEEGVRVANAGFTGWDQADSRAMRRLIPYNNVFYLRKLFDEAEAGINDFLGVPAPAKRGR